MKRQISPSQIPHLVRLTADIFRQMREETKSPNNNPQNMKDEKNEMQFVSDMLNELVEISYSEERPTYTNKNKIEEHMHFVDVTGIKDPNTIKEILNDLTKKIKEGEF